MGAKSRFIISRKDSVTQSDDVVIESEGLTIGRLIGNDLVLNHRAVSRTHAGIRLVGSDFWLFNLSQSNGTVLNGALVARTPIADGDVMQIGPFLMKLNYIGNALKVSVEMEIEVHPIEGRTSQLKGSPGEVDGTLIVSMPRVFDKEELPGAGKPMAQTGLLSGLLPTIDEQALDVFWDKRKREAGKIAEKTPLHPRENRLVGKAQFNWRPTLDLGALRRRPLFIIAGIGVAFLSIAAAFAAETAFSPGPISSTHSSDQAPRRGIAGQSNGGSCISCHTPFAAVDSNCMACHRTTTFIPAIYQKHQRERMGCTACHAEHRGSDIRAGLVAYGICSSCHNGQYVIRTGENRGSLLPIPHGGSVGYPVTNRQWTWKGLTAQEWNRRGLPEALAGYSIKNQFHLLHQMGSMQNKMKCTDCHIAGVPSDNASDNAPRAECAKCHGISAGDQGAVRLGSNCSTCHQQHGESRDLAGLVAASGRDPDNLKNYVDSLSARGSTQPQPPTPAFSIGGAHVARQNQAGLGHGTGTFAAVPWYGWLATLLLLPVAGLAGAGAELSRRRRLIAHTPAQSAAPDALAGAVEFEKSDSEEPAYPHPVINPMLCIGCHACVEACPHDVLTIVNGIAVPVALDQCMEDTGCQVECPTSPKACIVINTKKTIPPRKVPRRNAHFMTDVPGIYLIGDVSGVPLIKNAVNEGSDVISFIEEDLKTARPEAGSQADCDVAVVGIGPAGLSAALIAKQRGLRVLAIEQDKAVSTIQNYPAGKYVFFKPDTVTAKGGIPLDGPGQIKEAMLKSWLDAITRMGLEIHEEETCVDIKSGSGCFTVATERGKAKDRVSYAARSVILAIGNRGTPMKLGVPGEDLKIQPRTRPPDLTVCSKCGTLRRPEQRFCRRCGAALAPAAGGPRQGDPRTDDKVKYKLLDPDDFRGTKCIVVGAGNSAIEAAVDLCGFKREGNNIAFTRDNEVTLVIRSDFKGDLKLGNKINVYDCMDAGRIKVLFRTGIKEITENEVVLMDVRTKQETARLANDYVFAMIGGERPTKFLQSIGVKIAG